MTHRLVLAVSDEELAKEAGAIVEESAHLELVELAEDEEQLADVLARQDVHVVAIHEDFGSRSGTDAAAEVSARSPELGLVLLARERTPELLESALRAGIRQVVTLPLSLEGLEADVSAAAKWAQAVRERLPDRDGELLPVGSGGKVIAVAGAKGGVGASTLAAQLSLAALGEGQERKVALIELDLQGGDLRTLLNAQAKRSVLDLAAVAEDLNLRHLEEALYVHRSGLRVLLAPEHGEHADEVDETAARRVLEAVRAVHDVVVVDIGATVTEANAVAAELATSALVVATPDVLTLQAAKRLLAIWQRLQVREPTEVTVVLNRVSRGLEVQPDLVRKVIQDASFAESEIPASFKALEPVINRGDPERLEDRKLTDAYRGLADELDIVEPEDQPEPAGDEGIRSRLGLESGQVAVETVGVVALIGLIALLLWQAILVGYTYVLAGDASREGARALAVDDPVREAVEDDLPTAWKRGDWPDVDVDDDEEIRVRVRLSVPLVVPGWESPIKISSSSGTSIEDEPLPDSQSSLGPLEEGGT